MIIGVGMDLVEIKRIDKLLQRTGGERFLARILTPAELALAEERRARLAEFVAGRFAAKEAIVKALGCGIGDKAGFLDIEVLPEGSGRPEARLRSEARGRLQLPPETKIHLSITHTGELAAAYAVVENMHPL